MASQIGGRTIPVVPALLVAVVAGAVFGTWLGLSGPETTTPSGAVVTSPSPTSRPSSSSTSTAVPTPTSTDTPTAASTSGTVIEMAGEGDATSEAFTVTQGWQIEWRIEGASIELSLDGADGLTKILEQPGPAVGVTQPTPTGTFTMHVTAEGSWRIRVVQP